jgi:hypothetical protein
MRGTHWLVGVCVLATACTPHVEYDPEPDPAKAFSPTAVTRLSRVEYDRTVRDLLELEPNQLGRQPSDGFPVDEQVDKDMYPFAISLHSSDLHVSLETEAAERLAALAMEHPERLVACTPATPAEEEACAGTFVDSFAPRAYRRTVSDAERAELMALYTFERGQGGTFHEGLAAVIQGALMSPHFLFHVHLAPASVADGIATIGSEELASRLSYFLWGTMPDDELLAAGRAGALSTDAELEAQARRMLADPRAKEAFRTFFDELYGISKIEGIYRSSMVYPESTLELRRSLTASIEAFLDDAFWQEGTLAAMFQGSRVYVDERMSGVYGLGTVTGTTVQPIEADPTRYAGLLTQPALMALVAHYDGSDPIHRGLFVRRRFLCLNLPPPPMELMNNVMPPAADPEATTRERYEAHTTQPACAGCHRVIDPLGFALEHFDGIGRWRDTENGKPIDATGTIVGLGDADIPVDGAVDMARVLAESGAVDRCFTQQLYYFANHKAADEADVLELERLTAGFKGAGGGFQELLVDIVVSPSFRTRRAEGGSTL